MLSSIFIYYEIDQIVIRKARKSETKRDHMFKFLKQLIFLIKLIKLIFTNKNIIFYIFYEI